MPIKQDKLNPSAAQISLAEARVLKEKAIELGIEARKLNENSHTAIAKRMLCNVLSGLSIELYLKTFMISGRSGLVNRGHSLKDLYLEFPDFLKNDLAQL